MRICVILEGCYPYVRGGVSSWIHSYMQAMPQHKFLLWVIGAEAKNRGKFKYELPSNVEEIHEVFLDEAMNLSTKGKKQLHFSETEIEAHRKLIHSEEPDWNVLYRLYNTKQVSIMSFLMSEFFLEILIEISREKYKYISFAEFFHTQRSMLLPMLFLMKQKIPDADIYHSTSTGYGGLLGSMASAVKSKPLVVTEHGIYTREREEEILRSDWVKPYFQDSWISLFYMLSKCAYSQATSVTALFTRAMHIQEKIGCPFYKQKVIGNGINYRAFELVPAKINNGYIDIAAIVRFHPIKDIKTMIYSFYELKQRVSNARLHILGDTDDEQYRDECEDLISQLNIQDILIVGNTNVLKYLEQIDFTILTSISEGQPLSVLESLAAKRPCVTTDVGCCRDLLDGTGYDHMGRAGICVPPMHSQAIASAMEFLCKNESERLRMGDVGQRRIYQSFLHEDMINNYLQNYKEVVDKWQASALS
ncbi:MAG: GT4 family glycosyltransferase PelF [Eubacteriales bacterium]|nr:GT4 family glycosyltransferase PelF [Eubacteriales bacterium]MDD4476054.1 GT4 family glycosyltransferase PelF [Eubacteriales bacterium]